jgi:hypothetical protein
MTIPEIDTCNATLSGFEAGIGYVEELDCGDTPDVDIAGEIGQYYDDNGTPRFYSFGLETAFDAKMEANSVKIRGIGNRDLTCMRHGQYKTSAEVTYNPTDTRRLFYALGIRDDEGLPVYDTSLLDSPVCVGDCLPTQSFIKALESDCDGESMYFLYNMMKEKTFNVKVGNEGLVEWNEKFIGQYEQISPSFNFTEPLQTVHVGNLPLDSCCEAFRYNEGDIWITRYISETVSSQIVSIGQTTIVVSHEIFDFNRDGVVDGNPGGPGDCYYDVRVKVNGSYETVSSVSSDGLTITLANGVDPGDVVIVEYNYIEQFFYVTGYEFTLEWNTEALFGIYKGLPIAYEIASKVRDISGSVTTNFRNTKEYAQYIQDEYFHIFFEQGDQVVFQLLYTKWETFEIPISEEEFIENSLNFVSSKLCVDSEMRFNEDTGEEGEGEGGGGGDTFWPVVNGFEV